MEKNIFLTVRIDYTSDGRMDEERERDYIVNMVESHITAFRHTIEEGLTITDCETVDFNK